MNTKRRARGKPVGRQKNLYRGISWIPAIGRWRAKITHNCCAYDLGVFTDAREAARAYDRAALALRGRGGVRNFPHDRTIRPANPEQIRAERHAERKKKTASIFRGLDKCRNGKWAARLSVGGTTHFVGGFKTEQEAAIAYDRLARHYFGAAAQLNFPKKRTKAASVDELRRELRERSRAAWPNRFRGVCWSHEIGKWRAKITCDWRPYDLGVFTDAREAARAYDRAALALFGNKAELNFPDDRTLCPANPAQLQAERHAERKKKATSIYRGVSKHPNGKYSVRFHKGGQPYSVGLFESEEEAAVAYDQLARYYLGAAARLNVPSKKTKPMSVDKLRRALRRRQRGFRGVHWASAIHKWRTRIFHDGHTYDLGVFADEREAARAYDRAVLALRGKGAVLNFPNDRTLRAAGPEQLRAERRAERKKNTASAFRGVVRHRGGKWRAVVSVGGRTHSAGLFVTEREAAVAYDRLVRHYLLGSDHLGPATQKRTARKSLLNFPEEDNPPADVAGLRRKARARFKKTTTSRFRGVAWSKQMQAWRAAIQADGTYYTIGYFSDEEAAARAYDREARVLHGQAAVLNFLAGRKRRPTRSPMS